MSAAFLQGLSFEEIRKRSKELKLSRTTVGKIYLNPPANVWRHLAGIEGSPVVVAPEDYGLFLLELLKPMYGLVDAPHLWQIALTLYLLSQMEARSRCRRSSPRRN
eukprot:4381806-Pyramimonas_sp.AAC.1